MLPLISIAILVGVPVLAFKGTGYRMLYVGAALVAFAAGFLTISIIPTQRAAPTADETQRLGTDLLMRIGFPVGGVLLVLAFACVVGAVIYRAPRATSG